MSNSRKYSHDVRELSKTGLEETPNFKDFERDSIKINNVITKSEGGLKPFKQENKMLSKKSSTNLAVGLRNQLNFKKKTEGISLSNEQNSEEAKRNKFTETVTGSDHQRNQRIFSQNDHSTYKFGEGMKSPTHEENEINEQLGKKRNESNNNCLSISNALKKIKSVESVPGTPHVGLEHKGTLESHMNNFDIVTTSDKDSIFKFTQKSSKEFANNSNANLEEINLHKSKADSSNIKKSHYRSYSDINQFNLKIVANKKLVNKMLSDSSYTITDNQQTGQSSRNKRLMGKLLSDSTHTVYSHKINHNVVGGKSDGRTRKANSDIERVSQVKRSNGQQMYAMMEDQFNLNSDSQKGKRSLKKNNTHRFEKTDDKDNLAKMENQTNLSLNRRTNQNSASLNSQTRNLVILTRPNEGEDLKPKNQILTHEIRNNQNPHRTKPEENSLLRKNSSVNAQKLTSLLSISLVPSIPTQSSKRNLSTPIRESQKIISSKKSESIGKRRIKQVYQSQEKRVDRIKRAKQFQIGKGNKVHYPKKISNMRRYNLRDFGNVNRDSNYNQCASYDNESCKVVGKKKGSIDRIISSKIQNNLSKINSHSSQKVEFYGYGNQNVSNKNHSQSLIPNNINLSFAKVDKKIVSKGNKILIFISIIEA